MLIENRIIDYAINKNAIDKWLAIKGEQKYLQFVDILEKKGVPCTWNNLDNLCRYDKRLLINVFKYMSFFEDYVRALVWNVLGINYKKLEKAYLLETINMLEKNKEKFLYLDGSIKIIIDNKDYINELRNHISHNKIMLLCNKDGKELNELLYLFKEALLEVYQEGFTKDINSCANGLGINEKIAILLL